MLISVRWLLLVADLWDLVGRSLIRRLLISVRLSGVALLAGSTGEARESTGVKIVVITDILFAVFLELVVTVLVSVVRGLLVSVDIGILTTSVLAWAIGDSLLLVIEVKSSVASSLVVGGAVASGLISIIVAIGSAVSTVRWAVLRLGSSVGWLTIATAKTEAREGNITVAIILVRAASAETILNLSRSETIVIIDRASAVRRRVVLLIIDNIVSFAAELVATLVAIGWATAVVIIIVTTICATRLVVIKVGSTVAISLFAGATGKTRKATGIKVIIVADILLTILLVLVVTVLMSIVGRLLVGVNVSVLATGILAAIDSWLLLVIKVEGLVSTATISVTSETLGVTIIETITSFRLVIVGRSRVLLDSISVTALLTVAVRGGGNTGESNKSE